MTKREKEGVEKWVCSKIVKRPNQCFLRKSLGYKVQINVHMMWNMNRPGFWLIPQYKPREELESATQIAIWRGKRKAFHFDLDRPPAIAEGQRKKYKLGSAKMWRCEPRVPAVCLGHMSDESPGSTQFFPSHESNNHCKLAHMSKDLRLEKNNIHFSCRSPGTGSR